MQVSLCKLGLFRMKMGRETETMQYVGKNNFLNRLHVHSHLLGYFVLSWGTKDSEGSLGKAWIFVWKTRWDLRVYFGEWAHFSTSQQFQIYSTILYKIQVTSIAMKTMWIREERWAACAVCNEKAWIWVFILCLYIPFQKSFHP